MKRVPMKYKVDPNNEPFCVYICGKCSSVMEGDEDICPVCGTYNVFDANEQAKVVLDYAKKQSKPPTTKVIGDAQIHKASLKLMRQRGGFWAAYQNHAMDSRNLGHLKFLKYGKDCTYKQPPKRYPDTHACTGWRYVFVGFVNLKTGKIEPYIEVTEHPTDMGRPFGGY